MLKGLARNIVGMIRYDRRSNGKLKPGDPAPDAEVLALDPEEVEEWLTANK